MDRRTFLRRGLALVGVAAVGPLVERRAPVAEAQPALADPPLVRVPPPIFLPRASPLVAPSLVREVDGLADAYWRDAAGRLNWTTGRTGVSRAIAWRRSFPGLWLTDLGEHWRMADLQMVWNGRPDEAAEPGGIRLSPTDFTNYGNLLTGMKRWRPKRDLGHGRIAMLTFNGVLVLEHPGWPPGILGLEA